MIVSNKALRVSGGVVQTLYPDRESWNANFTAWMLQMEHFGRLAPCLIAASEDRLEIVCERLCEIGISRESDPARVNAAQLQECLIRNTTLRSDRYSWRVSGQKFDTWGGAVAQLLTGLDQNYRRRTGHAPPPVVSESADRLGRLIDGGNFPEPNYSSLSHGDVHPANLGTRLTTGQMWLFDFDQAGWRDPVFDLAKIFLHDWRRNLVTHRQLALSLSRALNLTEHQFETRLRYSMAIECIWGLAYHLQYETACVNDRLEFLEKVEWP